MNRLFLALLTGLLAGCVAAPSPPPLTPATSPATALLRLSEELELLAPFLKATAGPPLLTFILAPAEPKNDSARLAAAVSQLREAPNLINKLVEIGPGNPMGNRVEQQTRIKQQLLGILRQRPDLDLAWYWLADAEPADSAAVTDLSRAIALNPHVGYYYRQRGTRYQLQRDYAASITDLRRAAAFFHPSWDVYRELADMYILAKDDAHYQIIWEQRQQEMREAVARLDASGPHNALQLDSVSKLRDEISYGYLARAEYFIEHRQQPTRACPDLQRAVGAGVEEARELQKKHCR